MKKLITIAAMAMLATVSWAQVVLTNNEVIVVKGPLNIDLKLKTSLGSNATLTGGKWARVQEISGIVTSPVFDVIGTAITESILDTNTFAPGTNVLTTSLSTNVFLASDTPVDLGKGKFAEAMFSDSAAPFGLSNAAWFVQGSIKDSSKGTSVSGKVEGIYREGASAFKGTFKNSKTQ
jgi:hypothetical protein